MRGTQGRDDSIRRLDAPAQPDQQEMLDLVRRATNIRRLTAIILPAMVAVSVFHLIVLSQFASWTVMAFTIVAGLGSSAAFLVVRRVAGRGRLPLAGWLMVGVVCVFFSSFALVFTGMALAYGMAVLGLGTALAVLVVPKRSIRWVVGAVLVSAGVPVVLDRIVPWQRIDVTEHRLLLGANYALVGVVVLLLLWGLVRAFQRLQTIRSRLLVTTVLLVLVVAAAVGASSAVFALRDARTRTQAQLEAIVALKKEVILTWIEDLQTALDALLSESYYRANARVVLNQVEGMNIDQAITFIDTRLRTEIERTERFEEIMMMDLDGIVALSTDPAREGEDWSSREYFQRGQEGWYVDTPAYDSVSSEMSVFFSQPVYDGLGYLVGVVVGRANLDRLNEITAGAAGLGESGQIYVMTDKRVPLTTLKTDDGSLFLPGSLAEAAASRSQHPGIEAFTDYSGVSVFGAYGWVEGLNVALIAQQDAQEVTVGAQRTVLVDVGVAIGAALVAALGSVLLAQSIAGPLSNLSDTATQIAAGNLALSAAVQREDEVGALAQSFNSMTEQLRVLVAGLEQRVGEATRNLEAAVDITRIASAVLDLDALQRQVVDLILERFGLYYVGLFLVEETGQYAVLRAGTGEFGRAMLLQGHRLEVGGGTMVGQCVEHNTQMVAQDVEKQEAWFRNPLLPATRSELALPMRARGRVIGALTVQSAQVNAWDERVMDVLQSVADQVAVAIDNARNFGETQQALAAARAVQERYLGQAWREYVDRQQVSGYQYESAGEGRILAIEESTGSEPDSQAPGAASSESVLTVPVMQGDRVVAMLGFERGGCEWGAQDTALVQGIAEQLGLAVETQRLLDATQLRAAREQLTLRIAEQVRGALDVEEILQVASLSLGQELGATDVVVRLGTERTLLGQSDPNASVDRS